MFYKEYEPSPALKEYIICFWALEHDYKDVAHDHEQLWADTHAELIFSYGEPYVWDKGNKKITLPASFIIGPFKGALYLRSAGLTGFVAVRFHAWGIYHLLRIAAGQVIDNIIAAKDALHPGAIPPDMTGIVDREEKIKMLDAHFSNFFNTVVPCQSQPIAEEIVSRQGIVNIAELADAFNTSNRQLERIFQKEIGMSAKMFARITRFVHAKQLIENNPDIPLAQLTYETGYSDQAHFTRNFKELFDVTPARFKKDVKQLYERYAG